MSSYYPIIPLPEPLTKRVRQEETMGTKVKFWLQNAHSGQRVMVKYARPNTGEDWSEKLAFELGRKLYIPCPRVDLFNASNGYGVLCWDFLGRPRPHTIGGGSLIHGNELLFARDGAYPMGTKYQVKEHTLAAVQAALGNSLPRPTNPEQGDGFRDGFDTFVGYLMLDALIGNTDRHHENWGVESQRIEEDHVLRIAPSYDHASSLGRELDDVKRQGRLDSSGRGTIADYANKAISALWSTDGRKLTVLEAFQHAAALRPTAAEIWKTQLQRTTLDALTGEVDRVPPSRLSETGKTFVRALLEHKYRSILEPSA